MTIPYHMRWRPGCWVIDGIAYFPRGVIQQIVVQHTDRILKQLITPPRRTP